MIRVRIKNSDEFGYFIIQIQSSSCSTPENDYFAKYTNTPNKEMNLRNAEQKQNQKS